MLLYLKIYIENVFIRGDYILYSLTKHILIVENKINSKILLVFYFPTLGINWNGR